MTETKNEKKGGPGKIAEPQIRSLLGGLVSETQAKGSMMTEASFVESSPLVRYSSAEELASVFEAKKQASNGTAGGIATGDARPEQGVRW